MLLIFSGDSFRSNNEINIEFIIPFGPRITTNPIATTTVGKINGNEMIDLSIVFPKKLYLANPYGFSKKTKNEVLTISTFDKPSVIKFKSKLIKYVS